MRVAQVSKAGGPFEIVERDTPAPGPGEVRIKVEACAICHSDAPVKNAVYPALQRPRVPGHEICGLGHRGGQFARPIGFQTVAIGRGDDKEALAKKLGAHAYIDSGATDAAAELKKLGGVQLILATAPDAKSISGIVGGEREAAGRRSTRADQGEREADCRPENANPGMAVGRLHRFRRHASIQRTQRSSADD